MGKTACQSDNGKKKKKKDIFEASLDRKIDKNSQLLSHKQPIF